VRYDKRLPANSKLLYGEITALCNEKGFCWAGDKYFADLYGVSKTTVQNWLKALFENNYISKEIEYKEGSKEILHRYIRILEYPTQENLHTPTQENLRDNNTLINNTKNNMSSSEKIPYKEIISYLNQVTNKKYKVTQKWKDLIKARWNEGQRLDDFKKVINVKSSQWLNDSNMNKYLRPQTLFGNKFDDYLQEFREPIKPKQTKNDFEGLEDLFGDPA
jgi:uncharacterized phage protein (TIGR02220 family)